MSKSFCLSCLYFFVSLIKWFIKFHFTLLFYSPLTVLPNNFTVNWSHFVVVQCQVFARYKSHVSLIFESMSCRWFRMSLWCWWCCFLPLKPETLPRANISDRKTYSQMYVEIKDYFFFRLVLQKLATVVMIIICDGKNIGMMSIDRDSSFSFLLFLIIDKWFPFAG